MITGQCPLGLDAAGADAAGEGFVCQLNRGRVGRVSRSFDCQLEIVPVDLDLT
jgi:hypothetical protein